MDRNEPVSSSLLLASVHWSSWHSLSNIPFLAISSLRRGLDIADDHVRRSDDPLFSTDGSVRERFFTATRTALW